MRVAITKPLFAWDCLDDSPDLKTIAQFLHALPDGRLLEALRRWRGRGRDDYPITALWGVVVLTPLLRLATIEACLAELARNPSLRQLIGISCREEIPRPWNVSRFQTVLGREPHLTLLREMFDTMIRRLGQAVGDLGRRTAGDSTGLSARLGRSEGAPSPLEGPTGGTKEYTDEDGKVTKVLTWFGYKLHLLVDVDHEVALAYRTTSANRGDNEMLGALVEQARANLGDDPKAQPAVSRIQTLAYDKAADTQEAHELLDACGISPLVQMRSLWKSEHERMLPGHDADSNVVHDEAGTIYCYDKVSDPPVRRAMAYIGHEKSRGTLKYRCPACHSRSFRCPSHARCNAGKKYGMTVRVKREIDLRRFPPIPRATKTFEREYKGRTAVERVNARTKIFWGADDGNVTGPERFHANVAVVMLVHAGLATLLASCPRRVGTLGATRLSPIAQALHAPIKT